MKFLSFLVFASFLFSCQSTDKPTDKNGNPQIVENSNKIVEKRGDMVITKIKPTEGATDLKNQEVIGIYFSATVYTGATDYFFKNPKGETFNFRQTNFEEEQTFKLPKGMLEPISEGVPGANKAMIGKRFKINYGPDGKVVAVQLLN